MSFIQLTLSGQYIEGRPTWVNPEMVTDFRPSGIGPDCGTIIATPHLTVIHVTESPQEVLSLLRGLTTP